MTEPGETTESGEGAAEGVPPLPAFPFTVTCLFVLPHSVDIHGGTVLEEIPVYDPEVGATPEAPVRFTLTFHVVNDADVPVEAIQNVDLMRWVAQSIGVTNETLGARRLGLSNAVNTRVVVQVSRIVRSQEEWDDTDAHTSAPLSCVKVLLDWHRSYKTHSSHAVLDLTWTRLWNTFPVLTSAEADPTPRLYAWWEHVYGALMIPDYFVAEEPQAVEYEKYLTAFARYQSGDPLLAAFERLVEVQTELLVMGRPSEAVYQAATASETFITNVSLMMLWEQGGLTDDNVDEVAKVHVKTLTQRAKYMQHLLGDPWGDLQGAAWGAWHRDVWRVRNGVVHAARVVSFEEGMAAMQALVDWLELLGAALGKKFKKYPRTCITVLGGGGLLVQSKSLRRKAEEYLASQVVKGGYPQQQWTRDFLTWREKVFAAAEQLRA